jgi:hypothetical protein
VLRRHPATVHDIVVFMSRPDFSARAGPVEDYLGVEEFAQANPDVSIGVVRFSDPTSHVSLDGGRILIAQNDREPIDVTAARAFVYLPFSFEPEETVLRPPKSWFDEQQWRTVTQYLEYLLPQIGPCVNVPAQARLSSNKLYQLLRTREAGVATPRTLVSSSHLATQEAQEHFGGWIRKNVSEGDPRLTRGAGSSDLSAVDDSPWIIQESLDGLEYRVYVIGSTVIPVEISRSERTPERLPGARLSVTEHSSPFANVANLVAGLGLRYAAVDCILAGRTPVVFDVNPNGSWQWLPADVKQPIQAAFESLVLRMLRYPAEFTN